MAEVESGRGPDSCPHGRELCALWHVGVVKLDS